MRAAVIGTFAAMVITALRKSLAVPTAVVSIIGSPYFQKNRGLQKAAGPNNGLPIGLYDGNLISWISELIDHN